MKAFVLFWFIVVAQQGAARAARAEARADWAVYRGDPAGTQFSPLAQIHAANVHRLQPAWTYHTGDATPRSRMPDARTHTPNATTDGTAASAARKMDRATRARPALDSIAAVWTSAAMANHA